MKILKHFFLAVLCGGTVLAQLAQDVTVLTSPTTFYPSGSLITVGVLKFNPSFNPIEEGLNSVLNARLNAAGRNWIVQLKPANGNTSSIAGKSYALLNYTFQAPTDVTGSLSLLLLVDGTESSQGTKS